MYHAPYPYTPSWYNMHTVTCTTLCTLHAAPPSSFFGHHMTHKPFIHQCGTPTPPCPCKIHMPTCNPFAYVQPSCPDATLMPTCNPHAHTQSPCPYATTMPMCNTHPHLYTHAQHLLISPCPHTMPMPTSTSTYDPPTHAPPISLPYPRYFMHPLTS